MYNVVDLGVHEFLGNEFLFLFEHEHGHLIGHFLVLADGPYCAGSVLDSEIFAYFGIFGHFDGRENFFDFAFDVFRVDVADNDDSLIVGTIPSFIIIAESLRCEIVDHFHGTDRQTFAIAVVGIHHRKKVFEDTHLAGHRATPFLMDYAAFLVDFFRVEKKTVGPVVKNQEAGILDTFAGDGYRRNVVNSFVDRCVGI